MQNMILPVLIAFVVCLALGPVAIPALQKLKFGQVIREEGPAWHQKKSGTPTMGGIIIVLAVLIPCLALVRHWDHTMLVGIIYILLGCVIGFMDDFIMVVKKHNMGLRAWQKLLMQIIVCGAAAVYATVHIGTAVRVPFTDLMWDMGWAYPPIVFLLLVGFMNSVNLTDGLDGLAAGVGLIYFAAMALMILFLKPLNDNLLILAGALTGACLGFLRFNVFPARVFMGDTGSLPLGCAVAWLAIATQTIIWLPVMAFMYAISSYSVMIQVGSFKLRGKRVFKMAPIHHHFEMLGYPETKIVSIYMIITAALCLLGLAAI